MGQRTTKKRGQKRIRSEDQLLDGMQDTEGDPQQFFENHQEFMIFDLDNGNPNFQVEHHFWRMGRDKDNTVVCVRVCHDAPLCQQFLHDSLLPNGTEYIQKVLQPTVKQLKKRTQRYKANSTFE